jgi:hypothetical protein
VPAATEIDVDEEMTFSGSGTLKDNELSKQLQLLISTTQLIIRAATMMVMMESDLEDGDDVNEVESNTLRSQQSNMVASSVQFRWNEDICFPIDDVGRCQQRIFP